MGFQPIPIDPPAGFVKIDGPLAASGRYTDGDKVRFLDGYPQKIGGWTRLTGNIFDGFARGIFSWNDLTARTVLAIGTNTFLYYVDGSNNVQDITPVASTYALTNKLSTVSGSPLVNVNKVAHGAVLNQWVEMLAFSAIGGITPNGVFKITQVVDADNFKVQFTSNASSTVNNAGGTGTVNQLLAPGPSDPIAGFGWGALTWGFSTWGTARTSTSYSYEPRSWALQNWGKLLLAQPYGGVIYSWDPTAGPIVRAAAIAPSDAPGGMRTFFVTGERFVVALGCSSDLTTVIDPMQMRWCDQGDYTYWTAGSVGHTAGTRRLTRGKRIIAGTAFRNFVSLIWTDTALYQHQFTGSAYVFDTKLAGTDCGLAGPFAYALTDSAAYWFGQAGFKQFSGGGVSTVQNSQDVSEWIFSQLRQAFEIKCAAFFNPRYHEVWWLFVTGDNAEPDTYAMVNLSDMSWATGTLARTAATRIDGFDNRPILASTDGYLYTHETGLDDNGAAINAFLQTGPFEMLEGKTDIDVAGFLPDRKRQTGNMTLVVETIDQSGGAIIDTQTAMFGETDGLVDLRVAGRLVQYRLRSNVIGGDFRIGKNHFEVAGRGMRR